MLPIEENYLIDVVDFPPLADAQQEIEILAHFEGMPEPPDFHCIAATHRGSADAQAAADLQAIPDSATTDGP